ncbi:MAG TPA: YncE family protein [Gemmatimonadaceae bacterium]|jgi:DNA-binding beta-propeller fold protein YncE|nr:YncE family protein [Gemmatimonadaceae bacterium]
MSRVLLLYAFTIALSAQSAPPAGTIVVSNMNDNTATLVDAASGRTIATLPTGQGPHEVAISHDGNTALVSNYGVRGTPGNSITVIDVRGARVARTLELGEYKRPHGMAFFPGDTLAAVTSETSGAVLVVDVRDGRVIDKLPSNGRATHMLGLSSNGGRLVAANIADGTISVIDPKHPGAARTIRVASQPEGIAIAPDGETAWAGSNRDSVVLIVDLRSGQVADTLHGFGLPYRMAVSPNGRTALVSDPVKSQIRIFDATTRRQQHVIDVPRDSVLGTAEVPGSPSPEGVAISPDSRWAFVTLQGRNRVATIDLARGVIVSLAPIGNWSDGVGFSKVVIR